MAHRRERRVLGAVNMFGRGVDYRLNIAAFQRGGDPDWWVAWRLWFFGRKAFQSATDFKRFFYILHGKFRNEGATARLHFYQAFAPRYIDRVHCPLPLEFYQLHRGVSAGVLHIISAGLLGVI